MIGAVLAKLFSDDRELSAKLDDWSKKTLHNWNGIEVGQVRPAGELA
jgi:L-asparaginase II